MKRIWTVILLTITIIASAVLTDNGMVYGVAQSEDIVIVYTGDLNCSLEKGIGLAGVRAYYNSLKEKENQKELISLGDVFSGTLMNDITGGSYNLEAMNAAGYTIACLGGEDFKYGKEWIKSKISEKAGFSLISCNALELQPYKIYKYGGTKVAYIGITDPEVKKQQPVKAYEEIQGYLDKIKESKPDYIIALGSISKDSSVSAKSIIENTKGINAFISSNSSVAMGGVNVKTQEGKNCLLTAPSGLRQIGELRITPDKKITNRLVKDYGLRNIEVSKTIENLDYRHKSEGEAEIGQTQVNLDIDKQGIRKVESEETKLGDLIADSIRYYAEADIGLFPASRLKSNIPGGKITYNDLRKAIDKEDSVSLVKLSGMEILDIIEMSCMEYPKRYKNFLQVSGINFNIKEFKKSGVRLDDNGNFKMVSGGYRVSNMKVNGKELSLLDDYLVACPDSLIENSEFTMLASAELVKKINISDTLMVKRYIGKKLKGKIKENHFSYMIDNPRIDVMVLIKKSQLEEIIRQNVTERLNGKNQDDINLDLDKLISPDEKAIKNLKLNVTGYNTLSKSDKKAVRIKWTPSKTVSDLKFQVWKSEKQFKGFKKISVTDGRKILDTSGLKKGKGYYYKVRAFKIIDGEKVYSPWSKKIYVKIV